ncbi:MAG: Translation factor pelota [Watsoniomyces obsoletus]|nr:MAG: Translation factor pelota [Watsoniomyces obsoletus]
MELRYWHDQPAKLRGPMIPSWALSQVFTHDATSFLQLMETSLQEIREHMLDDVLLQERLPHWRSLLRRFEICLSHLEAADRRLNTLFLATRG